MNIQIERFIGNPDVFAIAYCEWPKEYGESISNGYHFIISYWVIDNNVISNMSCSLVNRLYDKLTSNSEFIRKNQNSLYIKEFDGLTNSEIFELIMKSNQLEDEYDPQYLHLPVLENEIWSRHTIFLDETVDGFTICYYVKNDEINIIIKDYEDNRIISQTMPINTFLNTIDEFVSFLLEKYPFLK